jgi:hypothetical protein
VPSFSHIFYRVWILIIHYDFSKSASIKRSGNARDLELLQNLFGEYHDCTFREIASPPRNDIANILSQDDLVSRFENGQKSTGTKLINVLTTGYIFF